MLSIMTRKTILTIVIWICIIIDTSSAFVNYQSKYCQEKQNPFQKEQFVHVSSSLQCTCRRRLSVLLPSTQGTYYKRNIQCHSKYDNRSDVEYKITTAMTTTTTTNNNDDDDEGERKEYDFDVYGPLALLLISQFLLFIGVGAVIPSIPLYGKELGFSNAANGVVISAPAVALLVLSKFGGNYADQARKPAMMIGMAIIAISDIGTAVANGLPTLIVARLGLGAGRCISEAGERGLLADLANQIPQLRGRALATQQAVIALGIAIGAPFGGIIVEEYGPRAAFLVVSGAAIVALCLYFFLPETQTASGMTVDGTVPATTTSIADKKMESAANSSIASEKRVDWADLLTDNQWKGLALCQSGASFGFAAKIASIPLIAASILPGGAAGSGALLSAAGLSGLIGAPIGGWLTDKAGAKATIISSGLFSAMSLILIPIALGWDSYDDTFSVVVSSFNNNHLELTGKSLAFSALVLAWSTGAAAQGPALLALAQRLAPLGSEATAMALPRAAGDGTYIIAPFLLGLAADSNRFGIPGIDCALAGMATIFGIVALALTSMEGGMVDTTATNSDTDEDDT